MFLVIEHITLTQITLGSIRIINSLFRYEGDTGLIVRVQENMIVLFSDLTMHELKVLPRDLQLCSDMATGVDSLGVFSFGDMVQLDAQTVGVIVQIQKENFQVMYSQISFHC